MIPFLDVGAINEQVRQELEVSGQRVMRSGVFILGGELEAFEYELSQSQGVAHAVGVGNGLDALTLTLVALGIGPGDEVIVPAHTFIATWLAVTHSGANVVPVDIDPETYNIDPNRIQAAITNRTVAIVAVHLYGRPADMDAINAVAARHQLTVIADGAQSIGATIDETPVACFADATTLSFYPAKNLGALGDGGAVLTDDARLADRLRRLRNYGSSEKYVHSELGRNSRLDEMQAAFLRVKLPHLGKWNEARSKIAQKYNEGLADTGLVLPEWAEDSQSAWHLYVVQCEDQHDRDALRKQLWKRGVQTLIHYPQPPHRQGAYSDAEFEPMPLADAVCKNILSLPISPVLSKAQVFEVIARTRASMPSIG